MATCHPLIIKPARDDTLSWREGKKWKPTREHSPTTNFRVTCLQLFDVSSLASKKYSVCSLFKKMISVCSMKKEGLSSLPHCVGCCCPSLQLNVLLKLSVYVFIWNVFIYPLDLTWKCLWTFPFVRYSESKYKTYVFQWRPTPGSRSVFQEKWQILWKG